jgi:hypothetical protein
MAKKKEAVPKDEKFDNQDFNLFEALAALDKKDYEYYDRLSPEQQKKFSPYMMIQWLCSVKGSGDVQAYYLQSVEYHANKYFFNENIQKNPKLAWLMLCAASPGIGKQYRQWVPSIKEKVTSLKEPAKIKDIKEYFQKIYPKVSDTDLTELATVFVEQQNRKVFLAQQFPNMKYDEIDLLSEIVSDSDIKQYEKDAGI